MKLARNSKYWSGLTKQLVQYLKADRVTAAAKTVSKESGKSVIPKFVDAIPKPSASKL